MCHYVRAPVFLCGHVLLVENRLREEVQPSFVDCTCESTREFQVSQPWICDQCHEAIREELENIVSRLQELQEDYFQEKVLSRFRPDTNLPESYHLVKRLDDKFTKNVGHVHNLIEAWDAAKTLVRREHRIRMYRREEEDGHHHEPPPPYPSPSPVTESNAAASMLVRNARVASGTAPTTTGWVQRVRTRAGRTLGKLIHAVESREGLIWI